MPSPAAMKIGTKSILFGAHCFFIHPFFVAAAWWKLYGFPWDPRLWVAFFVHDLGYWGKPNMDGPEGESHPEWGARVMRTLFDGKGRAEQALAWSPEAAKQMEQRGWQCQDWASNWTNFWPMYRHVFPWHDLVLYHSRYYAKARGAQPSRLCFADKLAFALTPAWLYLPMVTATGEVNEYLQRAQTADSTHWQPAGYDKRKWHAQLCTYMRKWVEEHIGGAQDTWTNADRHAKETSNAAI